MIKRRAGFPTLFFRVFVVALAALSGLAFAQGDWLGGIFYAVLALIQVVHVWVGASWFDRGYKAGYRAARLDLWLSFHEGVFVRKLGPLEWLAAEADRDEPRIVAFGAFPGSQE